MTSREFKYLCLIMVIFVAACIETDMYLPAFPDMMDFFDTSEEIIQQLLTWNFIGICLSGPLYGPLADSFGRRRPLLAALSLFFIGSVITVFAGTFNIMLIGRILQGLGSGGCFTLGCAIIFDSFQEDRAVQAMSRLNTWIPITMAAAPMLGGYLNQHYGFRSNFEAIAIFVFISLIICIFFYEETHPEDKRVPFDVPTILGNFKRALTHAMFWQMILIVSLIFAGYLAFLSIASVLFPLEMGIEKELFPYIQAMVLGSWVAGSLTMDPLVERVGAQKIKLIGVGIFAVGGITFVTAGFLSPTNPYPFTAAMIIYSFGGNWVMTSYFPEGMELLPDIKGITSSIMTSARLLLTAVVVGVASHYYDGTIIPLVWVIGGTTALLLPLIIGYETKKTGKRAS